MPIRGCLRDERGVPVGGFTVTLEYRYLSLGIPTPPKDFPTATTNSDGEYEFPVTAVSARLVAGGEELTRWVPIINEQGRIDAVVTTGERSATRKMVDMTNKATFRSDLLDASE